MEQSGDGPEDRNRPQRLEVSSKRELVPCRLESPRHGSTLPPEPTSRAARGSRYREQQPARSPRAPAQESRPAFPVEDVPSRQGNSRSGGIRASHGRDLNHRRSPLTRVLQRTCRNDFQLVNSPRAGPCRRAPAATSSNVGPPAPTAARFGRAGARPGLRTVTGNSIEHVGITVPSGRSRPSTWTPGGTTQHTGHQRLTSCSVRRRIGYFIICTLGWRRKLRSSFPRRPARALDRDAA